MQSPHGNDTLSPMVCSLDSKEVTSLKVRGLYKPVNHQSHTFQCPSFPCVPSEFLVIL